MTDRSRQLLAPVRVMQTPYGARVVGARTLELSHFEHAFAHVLSSMPSAFTREPMLPPLPASALDVEYKFTPHPDDRTMPFASSRAAGRCVGGCSRGGDGPPCRKEGCQG